MRYSLKNDPTGEQALCAWSQLPDIRRGGLTAALKSSFGSETTVQTGKHLVTDPTGSRSDGLVFRQDA
jgi:hypothetical protein